MVHSILHLLGNLFNFIRNEMLCFPFTRKTCRHRKGGSHTKCEKKNRTHTHTNMHTIYYWVKRTHFHLMDVIWRKHIFRKHFNEKCMIIFLGISPTKLFWCMEQNPAEKNGAFHIFVCYIFEFISANHFNRSEDDNHLKIIINLWQSMITVEEKVSHKNESWQHFVVSSHKFN